MAARDALTLTSAFDFSEMLERLERALADSGNRIFARIDQAAAAADAGLTLRPTVLYLFGNPGAGTPLMDALPSFALELPLRVVVWRDGDTVRVATTVLAERAARLGASELVPKLGELDARVEKMVRTAIGAPANRCV
jgi:uncharacterized protein (DUF302 family)